LLYDRRDLLKNSGILELKITEENPVTNVISAEVQLVKESLFYAKNNQTKIYSNKTFFSSDWSVEDILRNAQEALTNSYEPIEIVNNKYFIKGYSNNGSQIRFAVDSIGNIISFYIEN